MCNWNNQLIVTVCIYMKQWKHLILRARTRVNKPLIMNCWIMTIAKQKQVYPKKWLFGSNANEFNLTLMTFLLYRPRWNARAKHNIDINHSFIPPTVYSSTIINTQHLLFTMRCDAMLVHIFTQALSNQQQTLSHTRTHLRRTLT